ncbi:Methyl-CpG binding domain [Sarracenia purpurea var. burkii]
MLMPPQLLRLSKEESNRLQSRVVAPIISAATSPFNLPDGWVVKEVSRRCAGQTDKYYYEPGTGRMFRSLISVERYLEEVGDNAPLSQMFKSCSHVRKKVFREKLNTSPSDFAQPPAKINWVLADSEGFTWNPFIGESMVPEAVKQRWANRFIISINEKDRGATDVAQLS